MAKKFDYRQYYKDYYNIDFGSEYEVHHIDFDRSNNDINNLLLLPKPLHAKYHKLYPYIQSIIDDRALKAVIDINNGTTYYFDEMKSFCEIMIEINHWKLEKVEGYCNFKK